MLFPYKKQGAVWGPLPWTVISTLACRLASPVPLLPAALPDPTQLSIPSWPAWLLFLHLWVFPMKTLVCLTTQQVMDLISPCSPGSQAGSILPLASLREGLEQPQQRSSQKLPTEQLGQGRKPAAPSRNSPAQRLGTRAEDLWELTLTEHYQSFTRGRRK